MINLYILDIIYVVLVAYTNLLHLKKKKQKYSKADYYFLTMKPNLCIYTNVQVDYIHNSIGHIVKKKKKKILHFIYWSVLWINTFDKVAL